MFFSLSPGAIMELSNVQTLRASCRLIPKVESTLQLQFVVEWQALRYVSALSVRLTVPCLMERYTEHAHSIDTLHTWPRKSACDKNRLVHLMHQLNSCFAECSFEISKKIIAILFCKLKLILEKWYIYTTYFFQLSNTVRPGCINAI